MESEIGFSKKAKLEVNVNNEGVAVVGNAEGYLALARLCTILAETHDQIREDKNRGPEKDTAKEWGPYNIRDYISSAPVAEGRFVFSTHAIKDLQPKDVVQDLLFFVSDQVGQQFWQDVVQSGSDAEWVAHNFPDTDKYDQIARAFIENNRKLIDTELTGLFTQKAQEELGESELFTGLIKKHKDSIFEVRWHIERDGQIGRGRQFFLVELPEAGFVVI